MGEIASAFQATFRDFNTDGVPASGAHEPVKTDIRALGPLIETVIAAVNGSLKRFATIADMNASTGNVVGDLAYVYANNGNPADAANGYYQFDGSAWVASAWLNSASEAIAAPDAEGNYFIGGAGDAITSGTANTGLGFLALRDTASGSGNTGVGSGALRGVTTGGSNTAVGSGAERANIIGARNTSLGASSGLLRTSGDDNTALGFAAMANVVAGGDRNVAIGRSALEDYLGSDAVAIGTGALAKATTGYNVAIGPSAGGAITTGERNIFIGASAGATASQSTGAQNVIAIGNGVSGESNDIVFGTNEHKRIFMFGLPFVRYNSVGESVFIGNAGNGGGAGDENGANVAIGAFAMHSIQTSGTSVAVGRNAAYWATHLSGCVAIGADAMKNANHLNTNDGMDPGTTLGNPNDCTAVGAEAGRNWQGIVGSTAVGRLSQGLTTTGGNNSSVGDASLRDNVTGASNVAMGYGAAAFNVTGSRSVSLGVAANFDNTAGNENVAVGNEAQENAQGSGNVSVGYRAGNSLTSNDDNIFIGRNSGFNGSQKVDATNSIAIGSGAFTSDDNQAVIGNENIRETVLRGVTRHTVFTVSELPAPPTVGIGSRAFVIDADATAFNSLVVGGGANGVPVFSDGTSWRIG